MPELRDAILAWIEDACVPVDWRSLASLPVETLSELRGLTSNELSRLPRTLRPTQRGELASRVGRIERLRAEILALGGENDDLRGKPPAQWEEVMNKFAANPSVAAWDALMRFTPEDARYQRTKNTLRALKARGVDMNLLFHLGSKDGILPDAIGWAEEGLVDPDYLLSLRSGFRSSHMKANITAWAACGTLRRGGSKFRAAKLLSEAHEIDPDAARLTMFTLCEAIDEELAKYLDQLGVEYGP